MQCRDFPRNKMFPYGLSHGNECLQEEEWTVPKKLDLTGQRFGKLAVLRPAENIGDKARKKKQLRSGKNNTSGVSRVEWLPQRQQ